MDMSIRSASSEEQEMDSESHSGPLPADHLLSAEGNDTTTSNRNGRRGSALFHEPRRASSIALLKDTSGGAFRSSKRKLQNQPGASGSPSGAAAEPNGGLSDDDGRKLSMWKLAQQQQLENNNNNNNNTNSNTNANNVTEVPEPHKTIDDEIGEGGVEGLLVVFNQCDANHDGVLTVPECLSALRCFGVMMSAVEMSVLFRELGAKDESTRPSQEQLETLEFAIDFEQFRQLITLWQGAARFRLFETRADELQHRIDSNTLSTTHFLPDSHGRWAWNTMMLAAALYSLCAAISTHMMDDHGLAGFFAMTTVPDVLATLIFALDLWVQVSTVVVHHHHHRQVIIDDASELRRHYLSTWFILDFIAMLPLRFVFAFGGSASDIAAFSSSGLNCSSTPTSSSGASYSHVACPNFGCVNGAFDCASPEGLAKAMFIAKILCHFRILKYLGHVRYFKESRLVPLSKAYIFLNFVLGQFLVTGSQLWALIHICVVIYCSFGVHAYDIKGNNVDAQLEHNSNVPYVRGLYLVLYCFATVGNGDVPPADNSQRVFFIFLVICGSLINAILVGNFVTFFQRSNVEEVRRTILLQLDSVLAYFEIPDGLREEVLQFENYLLMTDMLRTHAGTVGELPADLQRNLELAVRLRVICSLPYFDDVHNSAKLQLCNLLYKITFIPEEHIVYYGEIGEEMYFLNHGFVDVYTGSNVYLTTLKPGSYFGEMAVMCEQPTPRAANVKSITYCEFYVLDKDGFLDVIDRYPRLKKAITDTAEARRKHMAAVVMTTTTPTAVHAVSDGSGGGASASAHHDSRVASQAGIPTLVVASSAPTAHDEDHASQSPAHSNAHTPGVAHLLPASAAPSADPLSISSQFSHAGEAPADHHHGDGDHMDHHEPTDRVEVDGLSEAAAVQPFKSESYDDSHMMPSSGCNSHGQPHHRRWSQKNLAHRLGMISPLPQTPPVSPGVIGGGGGFGYESPMHVLHTTAGLAPPQSYKLPGGSGSTMGGGSTAAVRFSEDLSMINNKSLIRPLMSHAAMMGNSGDPQAVFQQSMHAKSILDQTLFLDHDDTVQLWAKELSKLSMHEVAELLLLVSNEATATHQLIDDIAAVVSEHASGGAPLGGS